MKLRLVTALFVFTFSLASCVQFTTPVLTSTLSGTTKTPIVTQNIPTALPSKTPLTTRTLTEITTTPSPLPTITTATPFIPPETGLKVDCLKIFSGIPSGAASDGTVILDSWVISDGRYTNDTYLLDMANGNKIQIAKPYESLIDFAISPDRLWVAYSRTLFDNSWGKHIRQELVISHAGGGSEKVFSWETGWVAIPGWLDNKSLVINIAGMDPKENRGLKASSLMVLNPFSGEKRVLHPNYPEIYDFHPIPNWDWWGETMYDPTLSRVVYPRWLDDSTYVYSLWDMQKSQEKTILDLVDFPSPRWSPDGSRFVIGAWILNKGYELYSIDRDGKSIQPLSNLSEYYSNLDMYIENYSWSPDGRYIAFWFYGTTIEGKTMSNQQLFVLDTTTLQTTNYCIPGDYEFPMGRYAPSPIWSPDGKQLIVMNQFASNSIHVILVDIVQDWAAQIAEDMEPVGWMKNP